MTKDHPSRNTSLITTEPRPYATNPAAVYLSQLTTERSRTVMLDSLNIIATLLTNQGIDAFHLHWENLRYPHTIAIRSILVEIYSPATVNRILSAMRGVLKSAWRLGLMTAEHYQRATDIGNVRGKALPAGRRLDAGEIAALVQECKMDISPAGPRDAAIIGVLYTCGLRRAEVVALDYSDYVLNENQLKVRAGKGRKQRMAFIHGGARRAMHAWLDVRRVGQGPLFRPVLKNGRIPDRRLTAQAIYYILQKRAEQAGVNDFSPHDLRRTFISDLLDRGVDIATVAQLAGHSDVTTTARYDRRPDEIRRKAANMLNFPF